MTATRKSPRVANDNRPPEFDAQLASYVKPLSNLAKKLDRAHAEDTLQDTLAVALTNWKSYRKDGAFYTWLRWQMKGVISQRKQALTRKMRAGVNVNVEDYMHFEPNLSAPATQLATIEATDILARVPKDRDGEALMRFAAGETYTEIADDMGVCRNRVTFICNRARRALREAIVEAPAHAAA